MGVQLDRQGEQAGGLLSAAGETAGGEEEVAEEEEAGLAECLCFRGQRQHPPGARDTGEPRKHRVRQRFRRWEGRIPGGDLQSPHSRLTADLHEHLCCAKWLAVTVRPR